MNELQLVTMVMFNIMIKKKVNLIVPLSRTVVLIHLEMIKKYKVDLNKDKVATSKNVDVMQRWFNL